MVALLADLDGRLQLLQRELEGLALPPAAPVTAWPPAGTSPPVTPRAPAAEPTAAQPPVTTRAPAGEPAAAESPVTPSAPVAATPRALRAAGEAPPRWRSATSARRGAASPPAARPGFRAAQDTFQGALTLDAGPFHNISELSEFERALAAVPGARDVSVQGIEGDRATFELVLGAATLLVGELQSRLASRLQVRDATDGRLSLAIAWP